MIEQPDAGGRGLAKYSPAARSRARGGWPALAHRSKIETRPSPTTASTHLSESGQGAVSRRIVVVEDNAENRHILCSLLELSGHQVFATADGKAGLEMIRSIRPQVALVDIDLPVMDGNELARQVRALSDCDQVYLVALTGYGLPEDRRRALEAGFDAHLAKPVDFDELSQFLTCRARGVRHADHVRPLTSS